MKCLLFPVISLFCEFYFIWYSCSHQVFACLHLHGMYSSVLSPSTICVFLFQLCLLLLYHVFPLSNPFDNLWFSIVGCIHLHLTQLFRLLDLNLFSVYFYLSPLLLILALLASFGLTSYFNYFVLSPLLLFNYTILFYWLIGDCCRHFNVFLIYCPF
jgi:hypothetical protein